MEQCNNTKGQMMSYVSPHNSDAKDNRYTTITFELGKEELDKKEIEDEGDDIDYKSDDNKSDDDTTPTMKKRDQFYVFIPLLILSSTCHMFDCPNKHNACLQAYKRGHTIVSCIAKVHYFISSSVHLAQSWCV